MLFLITIFICFITSIFIKDTRIVGFLAMMVLAYLAGSTDPLTTLDYSVYLTHFNLLGFEISPFERGYTQLSTVFSNMGFNYAQFRLFFAISSFVILFFGVVLFTKKVALFTGIYGITVFFNDATQIRNLMMISLVVLGSGLLASNNKVIKIFGIGFLLIATQFHDLGFIFLLTLVPLSFIKIKWLRKYYKYVIMTLFSLGMVFTFISNGFIIRLFVSFLTKYSSRSASSENVLNNFGRGNSHSTVILVWLSLILLSIVLVMLLNRLNIEASNQLKILFIGSATAMLVAFLIVLAPDYSRISRNAFLFLIILLCVFADQKEILRVNQKNIPKIVLIILLLISTTYVNTTIWGQTYYESIPYLAKLK